MRRFSLIHAKNQSIDNIVMNKSIIPDEKIRNVRDPSFKSQCIEFITNFLTKNNYEGPISLNNPTTRDFQTILKFLIAFIDIEMTNKFEEEIVFFLKMVKYPYSNEITKSQLSSITPYALPNLLAMTVWIIQLLEASLTEGSQKNIDEKFFDYCVNEYNNFVNGIENKTLDNMFLNEINQAFNNENQEIENLQKEIEEMEQEINNIQINQNEFHELEIKKNKQLDELNNILLHNNQMDEKRNKYIGIVQNILNDIKELQCKIDKLIEEKKQINTTIVQQNININDINDLTEEKNKLIKDLDELKCQKDEKLKELIKVEDIVNKIEHEIDTFIIDINTMEKCCSSNEFQADSNIYENRNIELKENIVQKEIEINNKEMIVAELTQKEKDLDKNYIRCNNTLNEIVQIYSNKKDVFDRQYEQSLNKIEKQTRDMLNLKLNCDYIVQNSEYELNNLKIELDSLKSTIEINNDFIKKSLIDLCEYIEINQQMLNELIDNLIKFN